MHHHRVVVLYPMVRFSRCEPGMLRIFSEIGRLIFIVVKKLVNKLRFPIWNTQTAFLITIMKVHALHHFLQ